MINKVKEVLSKSFEEVSASSLVLTLLECYSKLYLNGAQPGVCGKCMRGYYIELTKTGMEKAINFEEIKARTCKPAWNGLKFIPSTARHWNNELLTDKEAINLLEKKFLTPVDFEVLPAEWGKPIPEEKVIEAFEQRHAPKIKKVKKGS